MVEPNVITISPIDGLMVAILVVPLIGAFFIDLMNAVVIKSFISLAGQWPAVRST